MVSFPRDNNRITVIGGVSSSDGVTPTTIYVDPTTHRLLVNSAAGSGTVTSVSVVSANGFAGTVANATTTPAITLTTTITGILQGDGTAISAATTTGSGSVVLSTSPTITTPVLNGTPTGTGVATAATASTLVLRDSNANIFANNILGNGTSTVSAGGTTVLTAGSSRYQVLTGSSAQTYQLPNATTLTTGPWFVFNNNSSGSLTITNAGGSTLYTVPAGGVVQCGPTDISSSNGVWDFHGYFPSTVTWSSGTTGLVFNTALTTTPQINAGASSAANPSFIPQRGSSTTGYGGDSTHLYGSIGGSAVFTATATTFNIPSGANYQINGTQIAASNLSNGTTGSGSIVLATSPTLVTPTLGAATATTINKVTITAPATGSTLTIADGKTLTVNNSITFAGTDSTTMTFPTTSKTIMANDFSNASGQLGLSNGGTAANLTASNGGIVYSTGSALAILAGTATANKILYSGSSAAPSWSVPTFPVTASATSGKMITSDGTNWIASAYTLASPGTSGNVLTSDGTNWTSAAPSGGSGTDMFSTTLLTNTFTPTVNSALTSNTGSGTTTATTFLRTRTGSTTSSTSRASVSGMVGDYSKNMSFRCQANINYTLAANVNGFIVHGEPGIGTPTATDGHLGWRVGGTTVFASTSNGTSETTTDVTTTLTRSTWHVLDVIFLTGTSAKYYIDGSLVATHTTNLPTSGVGTAQYTTLYIENTSTTTDAIIDMQTLTTQRAI